MFVSPSLIAQTEASVDETLRNGSWLDVATVLPPSLGAADVKQLLDKCGDLARDTEHKRGQVCLWVFVFVAGPCGCICGCVVVSCMYVPHSVTSRLALHMLRGAYWQPTTLTALFVLFCAPCHMLRWCHEQVLATTCVVSAALIEGAKQKVEEFAKQEADKTLHARRSSSGGNAAGAAGASSNGSGEAAAAAAGGKKSAAASPARQRVSIARARVCVLEGACSKGAQQQIAMHMSQSPCQCVALQRQV